MRVLLIFDKSLLSNGIHILLQNFPPKSPNQIFSVLQHAAACFNPLCLLVAKHPQLSQAPTQSGVWFVTTHPGLSPGHTNKE